MRSFFINQEIQMKLEQREDHLNRENAKTTQGVVQKYLKLRQHVQDLLDPYVTRVTVKLKKGDLPLRTFHVGDIHFSHDDARPEAIYEAVDEAKDGGLVVLHANMLESVSPKFISTNTTRVGLNLDQQTKLVKSILMPLDEEHRVIPISGNTCHEGWAVKNSTHDPTADLVKPETPVLYTGGQVIFEEGDKQIGSVEVYHNSGSGRTELSPEGSTRARSRETPVGNKNRPKAIIDAHMHQLTAAQDVMRNPVSRTDVVTALGEVGAAKGSEERPDRFLSGLGVAARNQPADAGQGLVLIWKNRHHGGEIEPYPVAGYDRARVLFQAEELWEDLQRTNSYAEYRGLVLAKGKYNEPKVILQADKSVMRKKDPAALSEGNAPQYKTLAYRMESKLPVRIKFIGNLRVGSPSLERDTLRGLLQEINADPWSYLFATRRLINQGVSLRGDREFILFSLAKLLAHADGEERKSGENRAILGLMLTDELSLGAWSRQIKEGTDLLSDSLAPGDWLYYESLIKGIPLIMPETVVQLKMPSVNYTLYLRDKLSHFTSLINPYHGLTRVSQVWGIDADALIGGHTEVVGWRTWMRPWGQLEVIVPGGFSEYIEKGIGNRVEFPRGGQGLIIFPDKKLLYSFATAADGRDMHEALWMTSALKGLGLYEKTRAKLKKSK